MAGQSVFFRTLSVFNNGSKIILTNRINSVNFIPTCKGLKQDTKDFDKYGIPEKPKKPLTAYFTFMVEKRPILIKENPSASSQDIVKKLAKEWKSLSTQARGKYEEQAKQNKAIYEKKILEYAENITPEQENIRKEMEKEKSEDRRQRKLKKEIRDEHKPKRPTTTFGSFVRECNEEKGNRGERSVSEFMTEIRLRWANLPEQEKNKYKFEYNKNIEQYEKDLTAWEAKMIAEGKEKLVRTKTLKTYISKGHGAKKVPKSE